MKKKVQDGFNTAAWPDDSEKKRSGKGVLVVSVLVLLFLIILSILIKMNVGGFGTKVLRPVLKDVPVVNKILPEPTDEEVSQETKYQSLAQAVAEIDRLQKQVDELKKQKKQGQQTEQKTTADNNEIEQLQQEINRLKVYEANQKTFESTKEKFYKEVVYNDHVDISNYTKWYESMDPDTAAKLYKEAVRTKEATESEKELAQAYSNMKPAQAAAILQNMSADIDTVASILLQMDAADRGKIMGAMDSAFAAKITKKMTS